MAEGIDYASPTGPDTAKAIRKAGKSFVCRYVSVPGNPKNITKNEVAALDSAGLDVVIVYEEAAARALEGAPAGEADAKSAKEQIAAVGGPEKPVVYFAVDFDATAAQLPAVIEYFKGAASVLGKEYTGIYGGLHAVKAVLDAGVCKFAWQTYAWSGGEWDSRAQLRQYENGVVVAGKACDLDRAEAADFGQWNPPRPKVKYFEVSYRRKAGDRVVVHTKSPVLWMIRHKRARRRGKIVVTPVR